MSAPTSTDHLEDLRSVRPRPEHRLAGPMVSAGLLAVLCGEADAAPADLAGEPGRDQLVASGWFTADGAPTARTAELRRELGESRTSLTLRRTDAAGEHRGWVCAGPHVAVVGLEERALAYSDDLEKTPRGAMTFEVVPVSALPIVLARWGGLAPTWNYDDPHDLSDVAAVEARLLDATVPPPADADPGLRSLWAGSWSRWSIRVPATQAALEYLCVADVGHYMVRRRTAGGTVLAPRPGSLVWGDLQKLVAALPGQVDEDQDAVGW